MREKRKSIHYVNNAEFSQAVVDYVYTVITAKKSDISIPKVPDYVAQCFLRIAEGLSHKANFIRYINILIRLIENRRYEIFGFKI